MSSIYNLEPPTKGKVILKTTLGDIEIELWPKEAPKACRNFVQMCLEGYYDGTIFHRIIKDYLVQGGDPTGTGDESESCYGELFKDEFHTRLKFTHRGLVACANQNRPNSNGSQFFITLDKTEWLDQKNTIFGKIVGDTIYNLLRIGECGTDDADRPLEPPVLKQVEVVWNPFDDIVPRRNRAAEREESKRAQAAAAAALKQKGSKKNLGLLSFGEEAEEEEVQDHVASAAARTKIRSAHDALEDRRLAKEEETPAEERIFVERVVKRSREEEEKVSKAVSHARAAMQSAKVGVPSSLDNDGCDEEDEAGGKRHRGDTALHVRGEGTSSSAKDFGAAMHDRMMEKRRLMGDAPSGSRGKRIEVPQEEAVPPSLAGRTDIDGEDEEEDVDEDDDSDAGRRPKDFRSERNDRIHAMRMENKRKGIGRMTAPDAVENADLLKPWQLAREKYKQQKRLVGDREKSTLARLKRFTATLKAAAGGSGASKGIPEGPTQAEENPSAAGNDTDAGGGYDGKVRTDIDHKTYLPPSWRVDDYLDRDDLDASLDDLCTHKLAFTKNTGRVDDMARNMTDNVDDYVVVFRKTVNANPEWAAKNLNNAQYDPLLEKGKGKFSKAEQEKKKRQNEWSGRANQ